MNLKSTQKAGRDSKFTLNLTNIERIAGRDSKFYLNPD